jgi:hypothetical protein
MFSRLAAVWQHGNTAETQTPATAAKILSALGPIGAAFALRQPDGGSGDDAFRSSFSAFVKQHQAVVLQQLAALCASNLVQAAVSGAAAGASQSRRFLLAERYVASLTQQRPVPPQLLESLYEQFCSESSVAKHASPEALVEMMSQAASIFSLPAAQLLVLTSVVAASNPHDEQDCSNGALVVTSLVRFAVSAMHNPQQQQQQQHTVSDLAEFPAAFIRGAVEVLSLLKQQQQTQQDGALLLQLAHQVDIFLFRVVAPLLSQFGFEFLWRFISDNAAASSSSPQLRAAATNLLHYCQRLAYAERLRVVAGSHANLTALLLPEVPFEAMGAGTSENRNTAWVPTWWAGAFDELATAMAAQQNGWEAAAASVFRRYRFSAKVEATTSGATNDELTSANGDDDDAGEDFEVVNASTGSHWLRFYSRVLDGATDIPNEVAMRLQSALATGAAAAGSAGASQQAGVDPLMLACYFISDRSGCSFNGRRENLRRLSAALGGSANVQQIAGPFWIIAACLVLAGVIAQRADETDEGPVQAGLFGAVMTTAMLERLQAVAGLGMMSPVRLGTLVCGLGGSGSAISSAAATFRSAFAAHGFVRRAFAGLLRASWSRIISTADQQSIQFALSELVSLATVVVTRCNNRSTDDTTVAELAQVARCIAQEWSAALAAGGAALNGQQRVEVNENELAALCEVLQRQSASRPAGSVARLQLEEATRLFQLR